ncbi:MAG: hypothetical protein AUJ55_09705 [Proteobacteria bacterium CG1_02_64_396]|nr:MAG: hypothetical protein AUJ55_09705 [Proteobacteria bacterium CG1_02_64_396]
MSDPGGLHIEGDQVVLSGDLTFATVPALETRLNGHNGGTLNTFDLTRVAAFDSAGLALLVVLAARLEGVRPRLIGVSAEVASLLAMGGVSDLFHWEGKPSPP